MPEMMPDIGISIHALRVEGDCCPPMRVLQGLPYFYPRPPGGGRHPQNHPNHQHRAISIHALRVEGDYIKAGTWVQALISIHALRVEGDAKITPPLMRF